jgi:hypothetical protein
MNSRLIGEIVEASTSTIGNASMQYALVVLTVRFLEGRHAMQIQVLIIASGGTIHS